MEQREAVLSAALYALHGHHTKVKNSSTQGFGVCARLLLSACSVDSEELISPSWEITVWGGNGKTCILKPEFWGH